MGSKYCSYCKNREEDPIECQTCIRSNEEVGINAFPSNFLLDDEKLQNESLLKDYESDDKNVSHPSHYQTKSGLETINVIEAFTDGIEGIEAVCTANVLKYICRWKKKNGLQDLEKAEWYLRRLINHVKKEKTEE